MSLIYITKHDENIYNLSKIDPIEEEEKVTLQLINNTLRSRHVSRYHKKVIKKNMDVINISPFNKIISTKSGIGYNKTMGYADQPLKKPSNFLRKNEGIKWRRTKEHVCTKVVNRLPHVPKISELPHKKVVKDMIKININNVKKATVTRPKPKFAITRHGETRELCNSGIMPAYIFSPTFGKLPKYILKYNKIISEKQIANKKFESENQKNSYYEYPRNDSGYQMLNQEERIQILKRLKTCWQQMQSEFQILPVCTDTITKVQRKSRLFKDLVQLEKDIMLFTNNPLIYVCT